jgi:hypothetical protein
MTDALGPGSLVECVKNTSGEPSQQEVVKRLTLGRIYTVTEAFMDRTLATPA